MADGVVHYRIEEVNFMSEIENGLEDNVETCLLFPTSSLQIP